MPRWLRVLILFLMVLSLVIYISPLQVEASSIAASIAGVTAVNVPAGLVYAAAAIALGVAAGTNDDFVNMVDNVVSSAGDWIRNGTVEMIQTVDTLGQKTFYADGQMMEELRAYFLNSGVLYSTSSDCSIFAETVSSSTSFKFYTYDMAAEANVNVFKCAYIADNYVWIYCAGYSNEPGKLGVTRNGIHIPSHEFLDRPGYYFFNIGLESRVGGVNSGSYSKVLAYARTLPKTSSTVRIYDLLGAGSGSTFITSSDLTLGTLPSQTTDLTDGSSARAWSETYTDNGLYVVPGSNDPDPPDENNGKWFWPLAFALTAADLYALSQMDEWTGVTPPEFGDYETVEEFEILDVPEVDFGQGIEIAPVTSPSPDTGGDPGTDPDTGGDSSGEVQTDYTTWFSRLYTIVENISGKFDEIKTTFQTWITDCKTAIEAIPSKFADWFANIKTSVDTFASNAQDAWAQAIAGIQSLPASIADALANLMPEADPEQNPPSDLGNYTIDLKDFFPFCIPFDLYDFFTCLNADPVAPVIEWEIYLPGGEVYPLVLDLSVFDTVALLLRRLQLLLFCTGLAFKTRDLIRG